MKTYLLFIKRIIFLAGFWVSLSYGAVAQSAIWESGFTFFAFFQKHNIPTKLYYNLPIKDRELTSEIYAGITYYTLMDDDGSLLQALIPIGDGMQIHIFKRNGEYMLDFTPMIYFEQEQTISISIQKSPYQDMIELTHDMGLVSEFLNAYKNSVNFRGIRKGDKMAVIYDRKYRLGKPLQNAKIRAAVVEINKKPHYIFGFNNGRYYNKEGKEIQSFILQTPVSGARISSKFSLGRRHPILGTIRPHYGVDYAAPKGTSIVAATDGVVIFAGVRGGYGKLIEIRHAGNLKTLYAHMSSFAKGMKVGKSVKRGQLIGRVGSTGLSTGPHLHFGLYRNNSPINPLLSVKAVSKELQGKEKEEFIAFSEELIPDLQLALQSPKNIAERPLDMEDATTSQTIESESESEATNQTQQDTE